MRDPRHDPLPGDIITGRGITFRVDLVVDDVCRIQCTPPDEMAWVTIETWRKGAPGCTVVARAEDAESDGVPESVEGA